MKKMTKTKKILKKIMKNLSYPKKWKKTAKILQEILIKRPKHLRHLFIKSSMTTILDRLKMLNTKTFRKKNANEKQWKYEEKAQKSKTNTLKAKNMIITQLTQMTLQSLVQNEMDKVKKANIRAYLIAQAKIPRHIRHNFWKTKTLPPIPQPKLRRRKFHRSRIMIAHIVYMHAIRRWTEMNKKSSNKFSSFLEEDHPNYMTDFALRENLVTYHSSYHNIVGSNKSKKKLILKKTLKTKYNKLKQLRISVLSKLPKIVFKPLGKYTKAYTKLTPKQEWIANQITWWNMKRSTKKTFGIDFFKTMLGQRFLLAYRPKYQLQFRNYRPNWIKIVTSWNYMRLSRRVTARKMQSISKRAWFYTNHTFPKRVPYYFQKNTVTKVYPFNRFKPNWRVRPNSPWITSLVSKRNLYSGFLTSERREFKWLQKFSWIPQLRNKWDKFQKKNKLYYYRHRLLYDRQLRHVVHTDKKARIKQILAKSTLPFYGHLRLKQFARLKEKAQIKKTRFLSREDIHLGSVERRLDVVVYRLNLAPNIMWARRLIQDGSIYVSASGANQAKSFEKMYADYKQNTYPLKLRDPQNLYKKTLWQIYDLPARMRIDKSKKNPIRTRHVKLKFLLEPLRNINYLTQPGDVILCAPGALHNQYKTNKVLWQKPIPTHLLTYSNLTETKTAFKSRSNAFQPYSRKEQTSTNVGVVLHYPTFRDLHPTDRIQKSFMRWMAL